ncbi:AimR family lysis-lysogeny pheromone receptor [Bacillus xiapuensis]|uniref:AimR family lysis-lysogeny pheromone receptor n=1 Tax=Bacillus xiapuensis TaxID=2014075 RepID=A0ABU6N8J3_9BACI|nr:AimR family lysis-lysogeny pheromone receptor [Bacillus xiapuensis]
MERLTLKQMFLNKIDNEVRGYAEELAKVSGCYSSGSNLKKVLKDEKKEFESIQGLLRIVEYVWGDEKLKLMIKYSEEVDPNKKMARNLLEYLAVNRQFEALNNLVDKMDNCKNKESNEWAKVYRMLCKYEKTNEEEMNLLLPEIGEINVTVFELKVFKKMLINYCYSQMTAYHMVKIISKEIETEVELIENNYIKEMYKVRTSQIMIYTHLRVCNDPNTARTYADSIINLSMPAKAFKAYAYFYKGMSYMYTSHEEAVNNLEKSVSLYEEQNRTNDVEYIEELIEFINVYWDKFDKDHCKSIKNEILLMIKKGIDATNYLINNKEKIEPEFYLYLEGCNSNSMKKWKLSMIKYINKQDFFMANLAKLKLIEHGEDEEILNEMMGDDVN